MNLDFKLLSENSLGRNFNKHSLHAFMKPYVIKNKSDFSLNFRFTIKFLNNLINYINNNIEDDFQILFVDTNRNNSLGEMPNLPKNVFFTNKWLNGFLTNFSFTKISNETIGSHKEKKLLERKIQKYQGISLMKKKPNLVICSNMMYCFNTIKECKKSKIKVACISGPSSNPRLVDFPIVSNDNNSNATKFIFNYIIQNISKKAENEQEQK